MSYRSSEPNPVIVGASVVAAIVVVVGLIVWATQSFTSTDPSNIGLVRNGGPLDNTQLQRDAAGNPVIVQPGSGLTNIGFASSLRQYPVTPRYWTIDPDGGADTNQAVDVPTKDGVNVGVSGQFVFSLNTDPKTLAAFDDAYGSRTFAAADGSQVKASDGSDTGFNAFLAAFLGNTVNNALRQEMAKVNCKDVIASCSLIQNGATGVDPNVNNQSAITGIQDAVNGNFTQAINAQLGGPYLTRVSFNLSKVSLPADLQTRVTAAQGAFAQVSEAQARVQSAQADAAATQAKAQAYNDCPGCLQIDELDHLPKGITVYAPGNSNIALPTNR